MRGTCTECGLDLDWPRVFTIARHPWLFEYHWRDRPVRRLLWTVWRAATPRRFWREVRLDDPVHLRPVWVITTLLLLMFAVGYIAMAMTIVITTQGTWTRRFTGSTAQYWQRVFEMVYRDWIVELPLALASPVVLLIAMPLTFVMIPVTLRRSRVRPAHVCRIALYGMILPVVVAVVWVVVQFALHAAGLEGIAEWINPWMWADTGGWIHRLLGGGWWVTSFDRALAHLAIASALAAMLALWLAYWWAVASGQYLRLPTPMRIVAAMVFISLLAGVTLHVRMVLIL